MDDCQEQDQYEERLKEVFNSFDASGSGSLCREELIDLCQSLHLGDATPALLDALLQDQDRLTARVDFDKFKEALILVLSSSIEPPEAEQESLTQAESPEIQPKFVKGSKRYGRRSTPEFIDPISDLSEVTNANPTEGEDLEDNYDSAVPRKRERWNAHETNTEEYEAEGQLHLWNPDGPSTPRRSVAPLSNRLEEKLREACEELVISWDGCAGHTELLALCDYLSLEIKEDVLQSLKGDGVTNVREFVSMLVNPNQPPTPSASTPYRQLKRHHSTQPFDEGGRRIATPSTLTSTIGMRLFSTLDDGSGYTSAEYIMDAWMEEGIENSAEILQALNFSLDGKLSLCDLTMALENELLVTKNGIHQAALASFKAEIRYLLECADREVREKEKIRSDLDKAEKLKTQLATEVDEHHSSIEQTNILNIRKLEQDHKEKLAAVRSELIQEMDQMQQQAVLQREELEAEIEKIREDETFLRDHLSISVKENRRLEMDLLDVTEHLLETQSQLAKLQTSLDDVTKEKFGDLDPGSADLLLQEEHIKQLRGSYEAQCRELQDRIDELQSELQEFHSLGRTHQPGNKPLSEELESKSPGMESDPGIGSEEVHPFSMSLEAEMMLEQLKDQHLQDMEDLRNQLESKINEFDRIVEKQRATHEDQKAALTLQHQQYVETLREDVTRSQIHAQELQIQLEQAELERSCLDLKQAEEREELEHLQEEEVTALRQQLLEARTLNADLEEQLKSLDVQQAATDENRVTEIDELRETHAIQIKTLEELLDTRLEEEKTKLQEEKEELEKRLLDELERERDLLKQSHEDELTARLEEASCKFEEECAEIVQKLTEQWQKERAQLDEQNNESLQVLLEEEMMRLVKEQEEKESRLRKEWGSEQAQLLERQEEELLDRGLQERLQLQEQCKQREAKLKQEWEEEKLQLEEDYEGMLQERLTEEREKLENEKEEMEKRLECLTAEEKACLEERHREAMQELTAKHAEERNTLSSMLDKLRDDITQERGEIESSFSQRLKEVEDRFAGDQESVEERFQADVLKLEQHYQHKLKMLSESHVEQKLQWEVQMQEAFESADEQRKMTEETVELERERRKQEWTTERLELDRIHREELDALVIKEQQLQNELDDFVALAQNKEIELSRQLNDLHNRLQGSLQSKEELLTQSDKKVTEMEVLLNQTVDDFKQEREELLRSQSELEAKHEEMISISELQIRERIELLTERDDLKRKIEELEMLLKQAAEDFRLEREELRGHVVILEEKLTNESDRDSLVAERDLQETATKELVESGEITETSAAGGCLKGIQSNNGDPNEEGAATNVPKAVDEGCTEQDVSLLEEHQVGDSSPEVCCCSAEVELSQDEDPEMTPCVDHYPESPESDCAASVNMTLENKEAVSSDKCIVEEVVSSLEEFESVEKKEEEDNPQDVPALDSDCASHEDELCHETIEPSLEDAEDNCLPDVSHKPGQEGEHDSEWDLLPAQRKCDDTDCAHDGLEHLDQDGEHQELSAFKLQALCHTATEENILLHDKVSLLQQKSELLENLLGHSNEKVRSGHQFLEENYSLKVKMLLLMEHIKVLEGKALKMTDLQIKYEDCMCENATLKDQNMGLEKRLWSLESKVNIFPEDETSHVMEISRMRDELFGQPERQGDALPHLQPDTGSPQIPAEDEILHLNSQLDVEDSCVEFEQQNVKLRRAIEELQDKSQALNEATQTHRSAAARLAEENVVLRQKIAALKEKDLRGAQEELIQTLEHLEKEKIAAQTAAESFNQQISELHSQSQQLEDEKGTLSERNTQNTSDMLKLKQQLEELIKENERREAFPAAEKSKLAACVSALEAELTTALEETAQLEESNIQLSQQLSDLREKVTTVDSMETQLNHLLADRKGVEKETRGLRMQLAKTQEKVKTVDETLQAVNHQSAQLKSDLRVVQQERESFKREVAVLHKQLQNANDKNHVLEMTLQSSGLQNRSKMSRLREQDDLAQSREKVRQLDASILSRKQHKHQRQSSLVKALEQENASLKHELEAQKELTKGREAVEGHAEMESLQQENEVLKAQMARLSAQLFESFQAHFVGLLPPSPHRMPRGQHNAEDADNVQDERERKMKSMEERMREIELSLHNVKLLLREKVAQLKDQLHRNGKADVLIKDLYVENAQLLQALDITEQRHKIAEKKNYLLEEKISSLNKIVRDLNPSPLTSLSSYNFKCS